MGGLQDERSANRLHLAAYCVDVRKAVTEFGVCPGSTQRLNDLMCE